MPRVRVFFYKEDDGTVEMSDWLASLDRAARDRCTIKIGHLHEAGRDLRRPHCENLGDGIYELRAKVGRVNYRMLYFFHGQDAVVLTHGFTKERVVPPQEIREARRLRDRFLRNPSRHSHPFGDE